LATGFKDALAKCSGCTVINVPWTLADLAPNGPWVTALRNALIKNPDAAYVWFPFDFNAIESGGTKAVLQSGSKAKVISNTGLGEALDLVRSGQLYAEATSRSSEWESWAAIDELNRHFNKQSSVAEGLGYISITKDHNLPATAGSSYQPAVDFAAAYKKAWGVG
jgi:ribose transport system substrate-binding protein